jgi:excisionase family DNA binding protein
MSADDAAFLTVPQFAAEFRCSERTAWNLVRLGLVRSVRVGGLRRIPRAALDEIAAGGEATRATVDGASPAPE